MVAEGKIRQLGVSNFAAWQIGEVVRVADRVGAPRPIVAQQLYNLLARRIEDEYAEYAAVTGLTTMVYNPLGGGLLTGKHQFTEAPAEGRFGDSRLAEMYRERYWNTQIFDAIAALSRIADDAGTAPDRTCAALAALQAGDRADPARRLENLSPAGEYRRSFPWAAVRRPGRGVR